MTQDTNAYERQRARGLAKNALAPESTGKIQIGVGQLITHPSEKYKINQRVILCVAFEKNSPRASLQAGVMWKVQAMTSRRDVTTGIRFLTSGFITEP